MNTYIMSVRVFAAPSLVRPLTKADFLAFLKGDREGRFEFDRGRIIDITGVTGQHSEVTARFGIEIDKQLDERRWYVFLVTRGVETPVTVRYPDVVVGPDTDDWESYWTQAPLLVVEVLQDESGHVDFGDKLKEYTSIASLEAYIVAEPDEPVCSVWVRDALGQFPAQPAEISGADGVIAVPALGLSIALGAVYRHVLRDKRSA